MSSNRQTADAPPIKRDRLLPFAALIAAVAIFGIMQAGGGAYTAEFDAHPDESAHFMTGLMIRDFLVRLPLSGPLDWAEQYYIHYPRIYFGRWPPLFHLAEGLWWLLLPPSRGTAMLLNGLFGWASAVLFYRLVCRVAPRGLALASTILLVAAPVFQRSAAQAMAELLSLLLGVLFLDALIRFLEERSAKNAVLTGLWCGLAFLVKGTGACLAPAPYLALAAAGHWRDTRWRLLALIAGIVIATGGAWHLLSEWVLGDTLKWGGMRFRLPWRAGLMVSLVGWGMFALAVAELAAPRAKRPAAVVASGAVLLSVAAGSFFLRTMAEPRHYILALPCLLLLAADCLWRLFSGASLPRRAAACALAAAALALFPWRFYRQAPAGYAELARQLKQPARMLVSSTEGWTEGAWVVAVSLREPRPSSVVARATKVLAGTAPGAPRDAAATGQWLDRLGFETVVLDEHLPGKAPPHHLLLREALAGSSSWKECARAGALLAYCRIQPPAEPREPLRVDLTRHLRRVLAEK